MSAITVSHLSKSFGSVRAVDNLSFTVEPGTVTGFLGPNGAGKTSTLRMILGLVYPTAGTATVRGWPYASLTRPSTEVGAVLEATAFHPGRTARAHLRVISTAAGVPAARADEVLHEVDLNRAADRRVGGFSLGMRQRLALASALLGDPYVLILDEPANGLDPEGIHWLRGFLREFAGRGGAVLVSSHVLAEIEQVAGHVVIVSGGRMVHEGALADLVSAGAGLEQAYFDLTRSKATESNTREEIR